MTPDREVIRSRIKEVPAWWHNIDIHGEITPGITPVSAQNWIVKYIDKDLTGLEVLDIGAWDGYYSFLAEQRGAKRVVALDPGQGPCKFRGFEVACELLDSNVEYFNYDVYQLDRIPGQFDVVFFLGVYYHLDDPMLALYQIFKKLKPGGTFILEGVARSGSEPLLYLCQPGVDMNPGDFCIATIPWLKLACQRIGFSQIKFESRYPGDNLWQRPIRSMAWHFRLRAGRLRKANRIILSARKPLNPMFKKGDSESRDAFLASHVLVDD